MDFLLQNEQAQIVAVHGIASDAIGDWLALAIRLASQAIAGAIGGTGGGIIRGQHDFHTFRVERQKKPCPRDGGRGSGLHDGDEAPCKIPPKVGVG